MEVEALAFVGFAFDFDELALACFDLAVVKGSHRYSNLKSSGNLSYLLRVAVDEGMKWKE